MRDRAPTSERPSRRARATARAPGATSGGSPGWTSTRAAPTRRTNPTEAATMKRWRSTRPTVARKNCDDRLLSGDERPISRVTVRGEPRATGARGRPLTLRPPQSCTRRYATGYVTSVTDGPRRNASTPPRAPGDAGAGSFVPSTTSYSPRNQSGGVAQNPRAHRCPCPASVSTDRHSMHRQQQKRRPTIDADQRHLHDRRDPRERTRRRTSPARHPALPLTQRNTQRSRRRMATKCATMPRNAKHDRAPARQERARTRARPAYSSPTPTSRHVQRQRGEPCDHDRDRTNRAARRAPDRRGDPPAGCSTRSP